MSRALALKMVERAPLEFKEEALWSPGRQKDAHSLHYIISNPEFTPPGLFGYFINNYSQAGDVVLDPFCGGGSALLEACFLGRVAYGSDLNPLLLRIARGKLFPADLTEIMLAVQVINLMTPIDTKVFNGYFSPFYDINTFRELVNLKNYCSQRDDRVTRFMELLAMSLLHGHSAGFFSAYSFPQVGLSPEEQTVLNANRGQVPDYRSVIPRILKKAASVLRDGTPSRLRKMARSSCVHESDARSLSYVSSESVDLVVTAPPHPYSKDYSSKMWLRSWFSGISVKNASEKIFTSKDGNGWELFMCDVMQEMARVVRPNGTAVIALPGGRRQGKNEELDKSFIRMIENKLSKYWWIKSVLINKEGKDMVRRSKKEFDSCLVDRTVIVKRR